MTVCTAKTGLNHFPVLISSGATTNTADLLFHCCLLFSSPHLYSPSAPICHWRSPFSTPSCRMIVLSLITLTHPHTDTQTQREISLLPCVYPRFWFGFEQGMFALSFFAFLPIQGGKNAVQLIIVCKLCVYWRESKERGRDAEIVRIYFMDRTSWWDMRSCASRRVHGPAVLLQTEGDDTLINLWHAPHLAGTAPAAKDSLTRPYLLLVKYSGLVCGLKFQNMTTRKCMLRIWLDSLFGLGQQKWKCF